MTHDSVRVAVLITMPHSHYSEKARWALDRLSLPYRETPHAPLLHRLATKRNGGSSVPLLVHDGARFIDSTAILMHLDAVCGGDVLYPRDAALRQEVEALETRFDEVLGPHARRWAYAQLLPDRRLLLRIMSRGVPRFEAVSLPVIMPGVVTLIRAALRITPDSAARSIERVRAIFKEVDARLGDGRRFLVDDRFTAADLAFAALAAPVLFPAEYRAAYPSLDDVPAAMRDEALRLRDTAAGRFAMRLYGEERDRVRAVS
ncbi:glutathione S-transferase family protein [Burkholderia sp. BCC1977]|uniref:glutathione S-transferase family protein n=1 Tax=Burkholderia sp. BCC1977 TaxID=2817440 RepID=UPI002ABE48B6|nr:glutathione S-transferase family protein [Burkholderia sp. BCC1977]